MTIDEAITHAKVVAQEKYNEGFLCHANPNDEVLDTCIDCAKEHEQLAEWLEELKRYKDSEQQGLFFRLPCRVGDYAVFSDGDFRPITFITIVKNDINIGCQNGIIVSMNLQYPSWCKCFCSTHEEAVRVSKLIKEKG